MHHSTHTSRTHGLVITTVILVAGAMTCGLTQLFGQPLSDTVGILLLIAALSCATIARF